MGFLFKKKKKEEKLEEPPAHETMLHSDDLDIPPPPAEGLDLEKGLDLPDLEAGEELHVGPSTPQYPSQIPEPPKEEPEEQAPEPELVPPPEPEIAAPEPHEEPSFPPISEPLPEEEPELPKPVEEQIKKQPFLSLDNTKSIYQEVNSINTESKIIQGIALRLKQITEDMEKDYEPGQRTMDKLGSNLLKFDDILFKL